MCVQKNTRIHWQLLLQLMMNNNPFTCSLLVQWNLTNPAIYGPGFLNCNNHVAEVHVQC